MVIFTAEEDPANLSAAISALARQLADMRDALESRRQQIRAGKPEGLDGSERAIADIRQWLRLALEAEAQLEKRSKRTSGASHAGTLDLDDARSEIGGRLDRLRRAGHAGSLSEQP